MGLLSQRARDRVRRHAWAGLLAAAFLMAAVAVLLEGVGRQVAHVVAYAVAAIAVGVGVRLHRPARSWPWWSIAAAMACSGAANTVWAFDLAAGRPVAMQLSAVDVLHLSQYALLMLGFLGLPAGRVRTSWAGMTEGGIVLCTGSVLVWVLLTDPFVHDGGRWQGPPGVVGYPWFDLLVLAGMTRLVVVLRRLTWSDCVLVAGALLLAVADIVYFLDTARGGTWSGPASSAACWVLSALLFGVAALHSATGEESVAGDETEAGGTWRTVTVNVALVLVGPAASAYLMLSERPGHDLDPFDLMVPLTASALTGVLLVVRAGHSGWEANRRAARLRESLRRQEELRHTLNHQARHDALTCLPNRAEMTSAIAEATSRTGSGGGVLILIDLDGFKDVNERLGHPTGDALLVTVAGRLRDLHPSHLTSFNQNSGGDVVARLGGDEFAVFLPGVPAGDAVARADRLVHAMRHPARAGDQMLHVTASAGVRVVEPGADAGQMLADADLALYAAKTAGKDCAALFTAAMRDEQAERIRLLERLRAAVDAGEFAVHYQPIVDLDNGAPVAAEALVRWMPPGQAPVGPDRFIPAAEDSGLIVALGEWVLRRACQDAAAWHQRWGTTIAVNVSPRQLIDPDFTAKVDAALRDSGLPAAALTLEITEGVLVRSGAHVQQAVVHLSALRATGVRVAIDDFGTGYSSLAYLRDLPIDVLKIDRAFMPPGTGDSRADAQQTALVRTIVDLARSLGLTTVAEGVETVYHADLLRDLGCDRGQGYHFARPIPAPEVTAKLGAAHEAALGSATVESPAIIQVGAHSADQQCDAGHSEAGYRVSV